MFGLYVGNSSACISMLKDGEVQVLVNDVGSRVTAASVEILDNERVVGVTAKAGPNNGGNVIFQSKMYLSPERVSENKVEGYCSVMSKEDGGYDYVVDTGSKKIGVTPKEVAIEIFHYLYKIASSASQGCGDICAILTVPHSFSQEAKDEFHDAALTGGFKILQVITDDAAAIMAYDCLAIEEATRKILVYRAGGTSIDVSVAHVVNGMLKIVKSVFEPGPSGNALTTAIFDYIARDVEM
ncbi:hypothetical protein J437_LFUL010119 [Ladona fulva]|uniref:Heat shock protein 70 n=1 Tax=Ladona fulva TaxID=123851 RepID=A0A8K0KKD3_LADFU|nr:hypothetical protein J437_LFUL010119 [Ladona fulva]